MKVCRKLVYPQIANYSAEGLLSSGIELHLFHLPFCNFDQVSIRGSRSPHVIFRTNDIPIFIHVQIQDDRSILIKVICKAGGTDNSSSRKTSNRRQSAIPMTAA